MRVKETGETESKWILQSPAVALCDRVGASAPTLHTALLVIAVRRNGQPHGDEGVFRARSLVKGATLKTPENAGRGMGFEIHSLSIPNTHGAHNGGCNRLCHCAGATLQRLFPYFSHQNSGQKRSYLDFPWGGWEFICLCLTSFTCLRLPLFWQLSTPARTTPVSQLVAFGWPLSGALRGWSASRLAVRMLVACSLWLVAGELVPARKHECT